MLRMFRHGRRRRFAATAVLAVLGLLASLVISAQAHPDHGTATFKALVFHKTAGFHHPSIDAGVTAIEKLGRDHGFTVDATEDAKAFTAANLAQYKVVVFLSTTGDVLDTAQQTAFEDYIKAGGGFAGVHAAADTEHSWAWYGKLVGAYFEKHPAVQKATIKVTDAVHPSTATLPRTWERTDEWYDFKTDPSADVHVLAELDESSYQGATMGANHPIAWCQDYDGGRSWYTGLGHTEASYTEPAFLNHLHEGIRTAAGVTAANCGASRTGYFQKVTLDGNTTNPMELAIADDGRVFYIDRKGAVRVIAATGGVSTIGNVAVDLNHEFGLLGIALDPDFATNNRLYLYYSPAGPEAVDRVSRFTLVNNALTDEKVLLTIATQRKECCHAGGALEFDNDGNLYIATGDNTNPFQSDGYAPIDEAPGRSAFDAQRTSANSDNLNGKILRITPQDDGTYRIPAGNMFPSSTARTRPEIFAMGFRNPFRIGLDPKTNKLQVADYGPDAGAAKAGRGPDGRVEWNIVDRPGFYGWPYCVGDNTAYHDFDFATKTSGTKFDCSKPKNTSPNNTGVTELPAAIGTKVWQGKRESGNPEIGKSGAPMAAGTYRFDPNLVSDRKWPAYWDGKAVWADWNEGEMFSLQLNEDGTGVVDVSRMLSGMSFNHPHAMQFGPDGALYLIEWGTKDGGSGIYRIDYTSGNLTPNAAATADKTSGHAPLTVKFDSAATTDPDGDALTLSWDLDGDGTADSTEAAPTFNYTRNGTYTARLTATDPKGKSSVSNVEIAVGNQPPTVTLTSPVDGGFVDFGDQVSYRVTVTDPEDGTVDCDDVIVQPALGHDEHAHPFRQVTGCAGLVLMAGDEGHGGANVYPVLTATYTDKGGAPGAPRLTGQASLVLQPKHREAEHFSGTGRLADGAGKDGPGVRVEDTQDDGGGTNIGSISDGDWFSFKPASLQGITQVRFRAAAGGPGGRVEIRVGAVDGPLAGTATVPGTGDWQKWVTVTADITTSAPTGSELFFVTRRPSGSTTTNGLLNVNWLEFVGAGVTHNQRPVVTASASATTGTAPLAVDFTATATDPEADAPITYNWVFGDGAAATGASVQHVYTTEGTFKATVTATDARGAGGTKTVEVSVKPSPPGCTAGRSDQFTGTTLDRSRWTTVVRENQDLAVRDGHLVIPAAAGDLITTTNTAPNIVVQDLPSGAFEATAKVRLPARQSFQQAGLVIYGDDDNYAKMVLMALSGPADASKRVFQFLREDAGNSDQVAESNTGALGAEFTDTVWVRLSGDGTNLTASYSPDGRTFTAMPQTKALQGIAKPKIGLLALGGSTAPAVVDAEFDSFTITPDPSAPVTPNDEFDGTALDKCRWSGVVREDTKGYGVADGRLRVDSGDGDIEGTATGTPSNVILQNQPDRDWVIETKVDGSQFDGGQQAGLIAYQDDANHVAFTQVVTEVGGVTKRGLKLRSESGNVVNATKPDVADLGGSTWYLRLARSGDTFTGSYSADGTSWTTLPSVTNTALAGARVGLFATDTDPKKSKPAYFDHFRTFHHSAVALTAALSGTQPGTFTLNATVTPAGAGSVQFLDGTTALGAPVPLVDGTATLVTAELAPGAHSFTARYLPADGAGAGSTSVAVPVTVAAAVKRSATETITVDVVSGDLLISVTNQKVVLPSPVMTPDGAMMVTSGALNPIRVTDTRSHNPGWTLSGQVTHFVSGANAINGANLGWTPKVVDQSPAQTITAGQVVQPANGIVPGAAAPDGLGLTTARTLATAATRAGNGTANLTADLALKVPTSTAAGTYTATLTLTAI